MGWWCASLKRLVSSYLIQSSYYSKRLGFASLFTRVGGPARVCFKNCFNRPVCPIGLSIRMMERVAGRSARMAG